MNKKNGKSKAAKSLRDLPGKTLNANTAKTVKGGSRKKDQYPSETVSFSFGKTAISYKE